jgi:hypothetical protein
MTRRDDPKKMTPGRELKDDSGERICFCAGTRFAATRCLEGLKTSCGSSEINKKKWACAQEALSDFVLS